MATLLYPQIIDVFTQFVGHAVHMIYFWIKLFTAQLRNMKELKGHLNKSVNPAFQALWKQILMLPWCFLSHTSSTPFRSFKACSYVNSQNESLKTDSLCCNAVLHIQKSSLTSTTLGHKMEYAI